MKVDDLKEFLNSKGLPSKGTKQLLIGTIEEYFENKN